MILSDKSKRDRGGHFGKDKIKEIQTGVKSKN